MQTESQILIENQTLIKMSMVMYRTEKRRTGTENQTRTDLAKTETNLSKTVRVREIEIDQTLAINRGINQIKVRTVTAEAIKTEAEERISPL